MPSGCEGPVHNEPTAQTRTAAPLSTPDTSYRSAAARTLSPSPSANARSCLAPHDVFRRALWNLLHAWRFSPVRAVRHVASRARSRMSPSAATTVGTSSLSVGAAAGALGFEGRDPFKLPAGDSKKQPRS